jgi:hypothetical protein
MIRGGIVDREIGGGIDMELMRAVLVLLSWPGCRLTEASALRRPAARSSTYLNNASVYAALSSPSSEGAPPARAALLQPP